MHGDDWHPDGFLRQSERHISVQLPLALLQVLLLTSQVEVANLGIMVVVQMVGTVCLTMLFHAGDPFKQQDTSLGVKNFEMDFAPGKLVMLARMQRSLTTINKAINVSLICTSPNRKGAFIPCDM